MRNFVLAIAAGLAVLVAESSALSFSSYAPVFVDCPEDQQWIRPASNGLSRAEANWVHGRKKVALDALGPYLQRLKLEDFNFTEYVSCLKESNYSHVPTIGMAVSGGGWGSAFTGTGALRAFDSRLPVAVKQGTGGLLQSLTYLSGLSGGAWPAMSLPINNLPTIDEMVASWHVDIDRLFGVTNNTRYAVTAETLMDDVAAKAAVGFNVSAADFLGRGWSYEFVPGANGGLNVTMSAIAELSNFANYSMPFPLLQAVELEKGDFEFFGIQVPYANNTIYEFTPFEFGTWDGSTNGFTPTQYLGTKLNNSSVVNPKACVRGFDRASFVLGAAGGAFNFWYIEALSNNTLATFPKRSEPGKHINHFERRTREFSSAAVEGIIELFREYFNLSLNEMVYPSLPNPFAGLPQSTPSSLAAPAEEPPVNLTLVDGSEDGQTIPLWSQIQRVRSPEFIIAWDDSEDVKPFSWNNGTNLYNTYVRANVSGLPFPIVPPPTTFINKNYITHPVFFGCDANLTTTKSNASPIIAYFANAPYSAYTNFSGYQSATSQEQMQEILVNSFNIVTQGNGTLGDPTWSTCLGCAAIDRSLIKIGMMRTKQCEECFSRYCWHGTVDDRATRIVDLPLVLDPSLGFAEWNMTNPF